MVYNYANLCHFFVFLNFLHYFVTILSELCFMLTNVGLR